MIESVKLQPVLNLYTSPKNGFKIYSCETKNDEIEVTKHGNFVIKGDIPELTLNQTYEMTLEKSVDKNGRMGYEVKQIHYKKLSTAEEQFDYLKAVLTKTQYQAFLDGYPDDSDILNKIVEGKVDVSILYGVGEKSLKKIQAKVKKFLDFQDAFIFFQKFGLTENFIMKLVESYPSTEVMIETLKKNPYSIMSIHGVGFKRADEIALSMGYQQNGEFRIKNGIAFILDTEGSVGHTFVNLVELLNKTATLLSVPKIDVELYLYEEDQEYRVVDDRVTLRSNYNAEKRIATKLLTLLKESSPLQYNPEEAIDFAQKEINITLSEKQKQLFISASEYPVNILEGYAGTGKSKSVQSFLTALKRMDTEFLLVSPSAIAAKVLTKYTGSEAHTIHRILAPLKEDEYLDYVEYLIIDEAGMVDVMLMSRLLRKCTHRNLKILFIGDPFQLPSIGEGNLLYDLINSGMIPKVLLDEVFRQKEGGMLDVITKIRQGERFLNNNDWGIREYGKDCTIACVPQHKVLDGILHYFKQEMVDYTSDGITITIPTKRNKFGTVEVNKLIQEIANPAHILKEEMTLNDGTVLREEDLVINVVNMYKSEEVPFDIVNGDVGKLLKIDKAEEKVHVQFDFGVMEYKFADLGKLLHFWSSTIHKMQGNSNKVVIAVLDASHKFQLNANLVYTACTRPEEKLFLICQAETLNYAMRKRAELQRNTFLMEFLQQGLEDVPFGDVL